MDISGRDISQIVAATVVYWAALVLLVRFRNRRRIGRGLRVERRPTLTGVLLVLGPPIALIIVRYAFEVAGLP
jgi:hypothetical protein